MSLFKRLVLGMTLLVPAVVLAEYKIGVVNLPKLMEESPQARQAEKVLQLEFEPRQKELKTTQDKLRQLETELKNNSAIMSENERKKKERELISGQRDLKRAQDEWREDLALRKNEEQGKFVQSILDAIDKLAKAENFDLVLGEGVYFRKESIDITDKVLKRLTAATPAKK